MNTSLQKADYSESFAKLTRANKELADSYPGESEIPQPVHTLYGGAQLFKEGSIKKISELALKHFETYAPDVETFAKGLGLPSGNQLREIVYERVRAKLKKQAVEDFRIDFEDGFGNRPDTEEDETALFAAGELCQAVKNGLASPYIGIRIKPFTEELKNRAVRTLDIFLTEVLTKMGGSLPANFVVTLPKVSIPEQVALLDEILLVFEKKFGLASHSIKTEVMIETTSAIINSAGIVTVSSLFRPGRQRIRGAHFGTYDYTASNDITAAEQRMDHPACDFALQVMKVSLAGTGIWLSDGATSIMPVPVHPAGDRGLNREQELENLELVHRAWKIAFGNIMHSLRRGYYQGWDLHPGQIPVRYSACYGFFLANLEEASSRLKNFVAKAAQATLVGDVFDDAATGQGLLNYFLRALNCGAIEESEITATGLTLDEVRSKSFVKIVKGRTGVK